MSETFLSRWARRKVAVRVAERPEPLATPDTAAAEQALDAAQPPGEAVLAPATEARADGPSASVPDDWPAKLPSLDDLRPDTDLSAFLQAGVPAALRKAALRRMWSLDPAIRDFVSEAREYAYDWNTPGGVPGTSPLLPIDDVKAMLKRVVDGVSVEVEPVPGSETPEIPADVQEVLADPAVAESPEREAIIRSDMTLPQADTQLPVRSSSKDDPKVAQPAVPRPRLRRHGGAMPS